MNEIISALSWKNVSKLDICDDSENYIPYYMKGSVQIY